jgi:hypothetical protein
MGELTPDDLDDKIFQARVGGLSARQIARQFHVTLADVDHALDRAAAQITERMRAGALAVELERMDRIYGFFDERAKAGCCQSALVCIKASERKSQLLALDSPVWMRVDAVARVEKVQPEPTSYDRIKAAINRLVEQAPPARRAVMERIDQLGPEKALALLNADNGEAPGAVELPPPDNAEPSH